MGITVISSQFTPNPEFFALLEKVQPIALEQAGEAVRGNLVESKTMPFDVGTLQNDNTFLAPVVDLKTRIITTGPQARRLYFHPEYNFQKGKNPNAGGRWLDPYLPGGEKQEVFRNAYAKRLQKLLGV